LLGHGGAGAVALGENEKKNFTADFTDGADREGRE
jgi:hypothetical protein